MQAREDADRVLMSARLDEETGQPIGRPQALAAGAIGFPFLFRSEIGAIRYGYLDTSLENVTTLRTAEASCAFGADTSGTAIR
jgi:hypothetical protein